MVLASPNKVVTGSSPFVTCKIGLYCTRLEEHIRVSKFCNESAWKFWLRPCCGRGCFMGVM